MGNESPYGSGRTEPEPCPHRAQMNIAFTKGCAQEADEAFWAWLEKRGPQPSTPPSKSLVIYRAYGNFVTLRGGGGVACLEQTPGFWNTCDPNDLPPLNLLPKESQAGDLVKIGLMNGLGLIKAFYPSHHSIYQSGEAPSGIEPRQDWPEPNSLKEEDVALCLLFLSQARGLRGFVRRWIFRGRGLSSARRFQNEARVEAMIRTLAGLMVLLLLAWWVYTAFRR